MKKYITQALIILGTNLFAQVGINTSTSSVTLDVAASANDTSIPDGIIAPRLTGVQLKSKDSTYNSSQTGAVVYITSALTSSNTSTKTVNVTSIGYYFFDGSVWQKLNGSGGSSSSLNASNGLNKSDNTIGLGGDLSQTTSIGTSSSNTLQLTGLQEGDIEAGKLLMIDATNNIQVSTNITNDLSIPTPAVFLLPSNVYNFLSSVSAGSKSTLKMELIKNSIPGLTYDSSTSTISFPTGIYQIQFIYEATHNATGCTRNSYIVDFPLTSNTQRIHSTAIHIQGVNSNHGGTISFTTVLTEPTNWKIQLGKGQSGNCSGSGLTLYAKSTQVVIFRLGNAK